nr:MAG TPA: hypothetical protein [Caudoviricetes sp.]DAW92120.1 MAG TPA: hypothetical protein [Bacteriophage sp.]
MVDCQTLVIKYLIHILIIHQWLYALLFLRATFCFLIRLHLS